MSSLDPTAAAEASEQFERRKQDHIRLSLESRNEAVGGSGLTRVHLRHEAFPEIDFDEIELTSTVLGQERPVPFLVSSMTAGHTGSVNLNLLFAKACAERGWIMGVGSQRREVNDSSVSNEWRKIRQSAPDVVLLGNLGLSQLINTPISAIEKLADALQAEAMIIHTNPLQECLQPEGTPRFKGGYKAIEALCKQLPIPVVVKETGCGFSATTLARLNEVGVAAVDVSGFGGTHWGRIEGGRAGHLQAQAAQTFADWGISTIDSLLAAIELNPGYEVWASGGIRSGLDAAKVLAMGASAVGLAKPILEAAVQGEDVLHERMKLIEFEFKTALFCTGCKDIASLQQKKVWQWQTT